MHTVQGVRGKPWRTKIGSHWTLNPSTVNRCVQLWSSTDVLGLRLILGARANNIFEGREGSGCGGQALIGKLLQM
jgi:hypothetical protein